MRIVIVAALLFGCDAFVGSFASRSAACGSSFRLFGAIVSGGGNGEKSSPGAKRNHLGLISKGAGEEGKGELLDDYGEEPVRVRFKNVPGQGDIVVLSQPGRNILTLGDENGIKVPRACRTGLCGTCTADLVDPSWPGDDPALGGKPGVQMIRCCSAGVMLPNGCEEMVIDLHRNSGSGDSKDSTPATNPMARFDDDWETSYVADYQKSDRGDKKGAEGGMVKRDANEGKVVVDPNVNVAPWDRVW